MGFGLHCAGATVVTSAVSAAAATTGGGGGGGGGAAATVGKILFNNFRKYFEYKSRFRPVSMFVSTDLPTILHTLLVITFTRLALMLHHLPSRNR